ncbi:MAG: vWA domain-containing protein, partial [Roseiflexaceae bacterium]
GFGRGADPRGLRYEASKMLVDLLDPSDRIGIVHFSDSTHILGSDQTLVRMDDTQRTGMRTALDAIAVDYDTRPSGRKNRYGVIADPQVPPGQTAYGAALQQATALLQQHKSRNRQALIFLTDGAPTDMGQTPEAINAAMQRQLDAVGVPVFLLMLKNPNETTSADMAAVTAAATARNHKVIDIASPTDIAYAMASVLTYLKPNLYIDTLTATPGTGRDQSVVTANLTAAHRVNDVTFVFAAAPTSPPLQVTTSDTALQAGNTTRVRTLRLRQTGDIAGAWTFRASVPATAVTGFAVMQSQVRMTLRYPDARGTTSHVMAYPRDAAHVIGAVVDGVTPAALAQLRIESMTRCDAVIPDGAPTPYTVRTTGLSSASEPLVWGLAPASAQPLFVNVRFQPSNTLALQRCYEMQATTTPVPLSMRQPVSERPDVVAGTLPVALALPAATTMRDTSATLFVTGVDARTSQLPLTVASGEARGALAIPQAGSYAVDMLVTGQYDGRPLALYASRTLTPQLACAVRRVGRSDVRDLGVLTSATALDLSLTCATAGDGNPQPLDARTLTLV